MCKSKGKASISIEKNGINRKKRLYNVLYGYNLHQQLICGAPQFKCGVPQFKCGAPQSECGAPQSECGVPQSKCGTPQFIYLRRKFNCLRREYEILFTHTICIEPKIVVETRCITSLHVRIARNDHVSRQGMHPDGIQENVAACFFCRAKHPAGMPGR
jgi:hypothetical protein